MLQRPKNEVVLLAFENTHTTSPRSFAYSKTPWLIPYEMPNLRAVFESVLRLSLLITVQTYSTYDFMRPVYGRPESSKTVKTTPPKHASRENHAKFCVLPMTLSPKVVLSILCAFYAVLP